MSQSRQGPDAMTRIEKACEGNNALSDLLAAAAVHQSERQKWHEDGGLAKETEHPLYRSTAKPTRAFGSMIAKNVEGFGATGSVGDGNIV